MDENENNTIIKAKTNIPIVLVVVSSIYVDCTY